MKIHIVSLQRTGSKSLYSAIHRALPSPTVVHHSVGTSELGEFLHCWSMYGYKFRNSRFPFDPQGEVYFRTHLDFDAIEGQSYDVKLIDGFFEFVEVPYKKTLTQADVAGRITALSWMTQPVVIKTQLASLCEEVDDPTFGDLIMNRVTDLFDHTFFLAPSDLVKWVCSNFLCDVSGVFVACPDQREAQARMRESLPYIPAAYIDLLHTRWAEHIRLSAGHDMVWTDDLCSPGVAALVRQRTGLNITVENVPEFSTVPYNDLILNYDDVCDVVNAWRQP